MPRQIFKYYFFFFQSRHLLIFRAFLSRSCVRNPREIWSPKVVRNLRVHHTNYYVLDTEPSAMLAQTCAGARLIFLKLLSHLCILHTMFFFLILFYKRIAFKNGKNPNFTKKIIIIFRESKSFLKSVRPPLLAHFYIRFEHFCSHILLYRAVSEKISRNIHPQDASLSRTCPVFSFPPPNKL